MKVAEIVTNEIIKKLNNAIENNEKCFWQKSWSGVRKQNLITGHVYHGINPMLLPDDEVYFLTHNQINQLKEKYPDVQLKEGASRHMITFLKTVNIKKKNKTDENEKEENRTMSILRYYIVYKASDVKNLPQKMIAISSDNENIITAEDIVSKSQCEIKNVFGCDRAYYSPSDDCIVVPGIQQFKSSESYYQTVFHEMIHSTGHEKRLGRIKNAHFADHEYSKEELVAEIGSAILMEYAGIRNELSDKDNVAYLKSWMDALKNNMNLIVVAAGQADKASEYILKGGKNESK